jgi:NAD-dependent deacetylase
MKTAVVFSGAGLSAESGIPTFRDSNGLWHNHKVEDVAHPTGWERDKELVLEFYIQRFNSIRACEPNNAHRAIARLQDGYNVINLTQNIDDLLERAGCKDVRHFHGSINKRKCEWHTSCSMLDGDRRYKCDYATDHDEAVKLGDKCPKCNGQMRPDVVWFDEPVAFEFESMRELVREVKYNDGVFLCVGTSGQVHPAAALIPFFAQVKNKYIVDLNPKKIGDYKLIVGKAGETLPPLVEQLLNSSN